MPPDRPTEKTPIRLLYVEDNALVRELTCELLEGFGREVVAFESAEDALQEFSRRPFDLVITDVSLPAMSGLDLAREVSRLRPEVYVIIASGYPLDLPREGMSSRWRSVTKPVQAADMDALIDRLTAAS